MTEQRVLSARAWAGLMLLALLWGGSFLSNRVALDELPPVAIVAVRVGGGAVALWCVVLARGLAVPRGRRAWIGILGMGAVNNALPFTLIAWGQQHIPSGLASILNAATAIFGVTIAALVFADERLSPRRALGVGIGFLGVATAVGLANLGHFDPRSAGQLAVLGAALSYGLSGAWGRAFLRGVPPVVAAACMLSVSSAIMVPVALISVGVPQLDLAPQTFAALGYLSLASTALAYLLFYWLIGTAGAGNVSLVTLLVSPIAILLGALVLGESLRPQAYGGFALLALGLLILDGRLFTRPKRRLPPPAASG